MWTKESSSGTPARGGGLLGAYREFYCWQTPYTGAAWLPVLHTARGKNHYSALFSNTARAHELGMIKDWVVIYRDDHDGAGQWTVVTARYGEWKDKRIVRGREAECATYYQSSPVM